MWTVPEDVRRVRQQPVMTGMMGGLNESAPSVVGPKVEPSLPHVRRGRKATPEEIQDFRELLEESGVTFSSRFILYN